MALPTTAGDTLPEISTYVSGAAAYLENLTLPFISDVISQRDIDFAQVGDIDTLNYLQWDYNTELTQLMGLRPAVMVLDTAQSSADIDTIRAKVAPTEPTLDLPTVQVPTLDAERPLIVLPVLPGTDVGNAPTDEPQIDVLSLPDAPTVILPAVPVFEELNLPIAPSFVIPTFSAVAPQNLLTPPTNEFAYVDAGYTSQLRDPIIAKLLHELENGGYGIDPNDEVALWGRARDRAEAQARAQMEEARLRAANMSFDMPQGAHFADLERARRDVLNAMSDVNREIALKRADLYVENRKFTYQQVQQLEQTSISLYNAIQERALNAARAVVELGIANFDATVRNYNAQLEGYRAEAQVFGELLRAELAKAEIFKAQIEAEKLRGDFNLQKVQLYQSQLNGIQTTVNLYKTRLEAVNTLAQIQQQKIEVFRSKVQVFAERVRAKAAEYEMYRSAVQGETAKLEIYRTDIQAHESRLRGEELRVNSLIKANEARVSQFREQVNNYKAQLDSAVQTANLDLEQQRTLVAASGVNVAGYRALVDAVLAGVETKRRTQEMNNTWNIAALNSNVNHTKMRLEQLKLTVDSRTEIDKWAAKFYSDPMTAALASISGLSVKSEAA